MEFSDTRCGNRSQQIAKRKARETRGGAQAGRMVPELRAQRLRELAFRVVNEFGGDLRAALVGPVPKARKLLKSFHGIANPGADRILLFAGLSPIAAVPSNCTGVLLRILKNDEGKNYSATYREEQRLIASELPETFDARAQTYLLLKHHGQRLCKPTNPNCMECPLRPHCAYPALNSLTKDRRFIDDCYEF